MSLPFNNLKSHQHRAILENMLDGYAYHKICTDKSGTPIDYIFLEVNTTFEIQTGLKKENVIGRKVSEVLPDLVNENFDWIGVYGEIALTLANKKFESYSEPLNKWYTISAFSYEKGFFCTIFHDITQHKLMQENLLSGDDRTKRAQTLAHVGNWELDLKEKKIWASEEAFKIYGIARETEYLPLSLVQSIVLSEYRKALDDALYNLITKNEKYDVIYKIKRINDDNERIVHTKAEYFKGDNGNPPKVLGVLHDITEKYILEEALQKSESLYRALMDNFPNGFVLLFDNALRYTLANGIGLQSIGYQKEEMENKSIWELFPASFCEKLEPIYRSALSGNTSIEEIPFNNRIFLSYHLPIRDANNSIIAGMAMTQDITERKLYIDQISTLNADLEKRVAERTKQYELSNKELEAFCYSVSHDLRTPLRGIHGFSQALLEDFNEKLDTTGRHYLQRISAGADHMGQLIDDLLNLSRINRSELNIELINLSRLVEVTARDFKILNPDRDIEFIIEKGIKAKADRRLIQTVLENLIGNSVKFTSKHLHSIIEFGIIKDENCTTFFIKDDGAGFNMAYSEKIFGVFQRLHKNSEFEGNGIGLANVQGIINKHGGQIWCTGEIEKGATFFFTLPDGGI